MYYCTKGGREGGRGKEIKKTREGGRRERGGGRGRDGDSFKCK